MTGARLLLATCLLGLLASPVRADGGTVRVSQECGGYRVTVFTDPTPLRVGAADVSVLVQDRADGAPMREGDVALTWTPREAGAATVQVEATEAEATNKLLRAARVELPASGWWDVRVRVAGRHGVCEVPFAVEVAAPLPRWAELWGWIALPLVPIVLFVLHEATARRRA